MNSRAQDRLYNLLPALYRVRDSAQGEPLRALLSLIDSQYDAVERDITGLYENWFIETCAEWVVPYVGDLLGVRPLHPAAPGTFSLRAYVANTLDYRRRKGTAAMLEDLAFAVTGWPARAVEFFELLATTQYLNHLRPRNIVTPDLRKTASLELLGGPFESTAHTADVRHIHSRRGRYNMPNIGIFLWRLQAYRVAWSDAYAVAATPDGRYTFDPLGGGAPLFNTPQTLADSTGRIAEINVPAPLRRTPLYAELEALRQSPPGHAPAPVYFGANPVLRVFVNGSSVPFAKLRICDVEDVSATDWRRPPANSPIAVSADPVRGRIAFPAGVLPASVQVSYAYGFSGDVGAGPYDRTSYFSNSSTAPVPMSDPHRWQAGVGKEIAADGQWRFSTLQDAVKAWNGQPAGTDGVIVVLDSRSYVEDLSITVQEGSRLLLLSADWPALHTPGTPQSLNIVPAGVRPHLRGSITVTGKAASGSTDQGALLIDGLLVEGSITVAPGNLGELTISHSTVTANGGVHVDPGAGTSDRNDALNMNLYRTICGPIALNPNTPALRGTDCIVTSGPASEPFAMAIDAAGAEIAVESCTIFGLTSANIVNASNSIFTGRVKATRRQRGCVRFSSMPVGSQTAQRYRCQPDLALAGVTDPVERQYIQDRLTPQFTSLDPNQPGFAQLGGRCAIEIATGADDEAEMGVFRYLQQPQRRANLAIALDEYLRFGLEAGSIEQA